MATDICALLGPPSARPVWPDPVPVLIRVPALSPPSLRRIEPATVRSSAGPRRRRRLRRGVKLAGSALLLIGIPSAWGTLALLGGGSRSSDATAKAGAVSAVEAPEAAGPPIVSLSLSLEPVAATDWGEVDPPLVRPEGYLLPALPGEIGEETSHAGG